MSSFKIFALGTAMAVGISVQAQLNTSNSAPFNSPAHLVQNVFMGGAITAMNFQWNGNTSTTVSTNQLGYFSGGGNIFGIDSGIIMSSGTILSTGQNIFKSASYSGAGDADILQVAQSVGWGTPPSIMRDRSVVEFDFVSPSFDSIQFEYCFGSEEWPVYPCSQYNDAFGFFISGPGISGAYSNNAVNVSIVPGTTSLPVAITSIHAGGGWGACASSSYAQYYNNGPTTQAFCFSDQNTNNTYGAFTDVFQTAAVAVQACDTYHVKLGIADGVDWIFDSDVFLKAHSFNFVGINVSPTPSYNPFGFDTALYEGCGDLDLLFTRVDSTYAPYTLTYEIHGTATMGANADFSDIPGCVYAGVQNGLNVYECEIQFLQDSASVALNVDIFFDNLNEVVESFVFIVTDTNVTSCVGGDTLTLNIIDQPILNVQPFGSTTLDCADAAAYIGVNIIEGLPPFTYTWSNSASVDTNFQYVQPSVTTTYIVQVEDGCGYQSTTEAVTVGVFNVPWSVTKIGDNQTISCVDPAVALAVGVQFNDGVWHGDISYQWSTGSTDSVINVFSLVDATYTVTVTRNCTGETEVKTFRLYTYNDPVVLTTDDIQLGVIACPGDAVTVNVQASGGYPPYSYLWADGTTTNYSIVAPLTTSSYQVSVIDDCGLVTYSDSVVVHVPVAEPLEILGVVNDTVPCPDQKVHFGDAVAKGGFGFGYQTSWDNFETTSGYLQDIIHENTPYTIKLIDGCFADTAELTVWGIVANKTDLELSLSDDTVVCWGDYAVIEAQGLNGGGGYKYFWEGNSAATTEYLKVSPTEPTTYTVRMVDACDSVRYGEVSVDVSYVLPEFQYEYINDYEVAFTNTTTSSDSIRAYQWEITGTPITSDLESPIVPLPDGNAYLVNLNATNDVGCKNDYEVEIRPEFHLYVPSGFTPNSDKNNEMWSIKSLGIRELKVEVYSRWGDLVFSSNDKNFTWDGTFNGKALPMGAYAWRMVLITDHDEYINQEGTVIILNDLSK